MSTATMINWDRYRSPVDGDFKPPTTVVELLERACEWAQDDARWMSGEWFHLTDEGESKLYEGEDGDSDWSNVACTDVRACAMAILCICSMNGPLLRAFHKGALDIGEFIVRDPLVGPAAVHLHNAIKRVQYDNLTDVYHMITLPDGDTYDRQDLIAEAKETVIRFNDDGGNTAEHHNKIARAFVLALEMARAETAMDLEGECDSPA